MSYADAWFKWSHVIEGGAAPLTQRMIALSGLRDGHYVLDLGTGIGEPALTVASHLGDGGRVLAIDLDPKMIALARKRAIDRGISNIDFKVVDFESLDPAANSLDTVYARWSLMFVSDLEQLLAKLSKALRPGGKLVAVTWASANLVPALSLAKATVQKHFKIAPGAADEPKAFALSDPEVTKLALLRSGFNDIFIEPFDVVYTFSSPAIYIQYRLDVAGPLWQQASMEPDKADREAEKAITKAMNPFRTPDGDYRMVNRAHCIVGTAD